jgi:phospholipid/cholesterol/gamma-HCH transport system substrate-binding protein
MATEANKFKVGAFLIAGFLLFNAALVWIGASHVLERREHYVTYFDESVQGLDIGSPVKYRGVPVGRVSAIAVAPDGKLVEVAMELAEGFRVVPDLRASVATSGITGVSVVEIGFARAGAPTPALAFAPPRRYIPAQLSQLSSFTGALTDIAAGLRRTDIPGLVAESRAAAVAARERLAGPEIDRTLARIIGAAEALETLTRKATSLVEDPRLSRLLDSLVDTGEQMRGAARSAQGLVGDPRVAQTLEDARAATAALRRSVEKVEAEVAALKTGERLDATQRKVEAAMEEVGDAARGAAVGVRETTEAAAQVAERWKRLAAEVDRSLQEVLVRVDRAAGRFEDLAASVEANPARLLAKPPQEDFR